MLAFFGKNKLRDKCIVTILYPVLLSVSFFLLFLASKDSRAKEMEQEPIMCKEKYHENEAVQYYCKVCNICICHKCSIVSHNRHAIEDIQRAAEKEKVKMAQVFAKVESHDGGKQ